MALHTARAASCALCASLGVGHWGGRRALLSRPSGRGGQDRWLFDIQPGQRLRDRGAGRMAEDLPELTR